MTRKMAVARVVGLALLTACATKKPGALPTTAPSTASKPTPVATTLPPYHPTIDPANFTDKITNPYFPLTPGTTLIYQGTRDGVPRKTEMTITKETKVIMGVTCLVIRDVLTSNNQLVEKTVDWYAQDKAGNVWYFGEDTKEYTNGAVSSTAGTWLAGVDNALPGIVMKAAPSAGDEYRQEYRPGIAEDFAKILQTDASATTPAGSYSHVVVTKDTDLLDASKQEQKSYAPGVGFVGSDGVVNGHHEVTKLSSVLHSG